MNPRIFGGAPAPVVVIAVVVALLSGCRKTDDYLREQFIEHSELRDPASVVFRGIAHRSVDGGEFWCGDLKSRNAIGAYAEWMPFGFYRPATGNVEITTVDAPPEGAAASADPQLQLVAATHALSAALVRERCQDVSPAPRWMPVWK